MNTKISEIFDVSHETIPSMRVAEPVKVLNTQMHDDADFARANLRDLIQKSRTALENALDVAVQSESPRAYEVLANIINTSADLNTKLIDVHQREHRIVSAETKQIIQGPQNVTNNVVFSGTTSELNDMITKRMLKNETSTD